MKARLQDKYRAIELRKQGLSYAEIQKQIPVSKGLLSHWLSYLDLSTEEKRLLQQRLVARQSQGRIGTMIANRNKRIAREVEAFEEAKMTFQERMTDIPFIIGVTLYWAEGGKRSGFFQFVNSDPDMVAFMNTWIRKYLSFAAGKAKYRLYTHRIKGFEHMELFWAGKLGIDPAAFSKTVYKTTIHAAKKSPDYRGSLSIVVNSIHVLRLMKAWQKLVMQYHGTMRP